MTLRTILAFVLALLAPSAHAAEKRYPLADQGAFVVVVPSSWTEEMKQESKAMPPTIHYSAAAGKAPQVIVTPIWRVKPEMPPFTPESMRRSVEQSMQAVKDQAAEKNLRIVEFKGASGPGFYFEATDKAPKPGEFRYLRQGMLKVGELLVAFTILTDNRQDPVLRDAMWMLQGAAHAPQK